MRGNSVQFLLTPLLIVGIGLPWVALQSAAWAGMLVSYARDLSLTEAAAKTFDGKNPCELCLAAARGQSAEDEPGTPQFSGRFEGLPDEALLELSAPRIAGLPRREMILLPRNLQPPPFPPPESI